MKFRTEVDVKPFAEKIDHQSRIFALGSCFTEYIMAEMERAKLRVTSNPTGVLFNPKSIHSMLCRFADKKFVNQLDIHCAKDEWFCYECHSSFNGSAPYVVQDHINSVIERAHEELLRADWVVLTFGTAWIYILHQTGCVVANCHKQPASKFMRRKLEVREIVDMYKELMQGVLADKRVIFTISPVRHLGDGADENFLSKATLKLAVAELVEHFDNAYYFPSYEILNDDLRDYRFYGRDLVHPSNEAVEYICEKFFAASLSESSRKMLPQIAKIVQATGHRPFNKRGEAYLNFCQQQLAKIDALTGVNMGAERKYFEQEVAEWHKNDQVRKDYEALYK